MFFTVETQELGILKHQWDDLLSFSTVDPTRKDKIFQTLQEKYSEEHRFYHNLSHVKMLFSLLESYHGEIQNLAVVRFSIWFHDVIYDPKKNDNEEKSARLAADWLTELHVETSAIKLVGNMILATKAHGGDGLSEDTRLFLDLDLAILGATEDIYRHYSQAIRAEYAWVPKPAYGEGRTRVLQSFLSREKIYATDEIRNKYEEQARKNIQAEIEILRSVA